MKHILLYFLGASTLAFGQTVEMLSLGAGYTNESYYSFANGEVANVDNYNWDLAFDLSSYGAAIRLNRKNATLYVAPASAGTWATLDTNGMAAGWDQFINGYDWWEEGALNRAATPGDDYDLGWGDYNTITHQILGSRVFVLEFTGGTYKKFYVESLIGGVYTFKSADISGANELLQTITKSNYPDRNFIYYAVQTNQIVDREPTNTNWDVVFTNYVLELGPGYFSGVTSGLHNYGVTVSEVSGVPSASATYAGWDTTISVIGYDWKSFNMATFQYEVPDSLTYFVQTASCDVWKMVFTAFEGSANGNIHFEQEQIEFAGLPTYEGANLILFPNPAKDFIQVNFTSELVRAQIMDMQGKVVLDAAANGVSSMTLETADLRDGVYFVQITDVQGRTATQKIMIH